MVSTIKFSEFTASVRTSSTNKNVGLSGGLNAQADLTVTWTTATRPTPPYNGLLGYNIDLSEYEYYDTATASWLQIGPGGTGSVTLINTGTGLTGGPITDTGTISFASIAANSLWANITGGVAVPTVIPTSTWLFTANNLSDIPIKSQARLNLGVQIGIDVEAWSPALDSIAALVTGTNDLIYTTASDAYSVIAPVANSALISSGVSAPSWSQTLPTAVQTNITRLGVQAIALNMNSHQINNVTDPTNPQDAATMAYVTAQTTGQFLPLIGGTMAGIINMGNHKITNMTDPSAAQDAVTINYLNTQLANYLSLSGGTMAGAINMGSHFITNLLDPVNPQDAATRAYVDLVATGLTVQPACYAATTANRTAIYVNGASGIGATLTNSGALAQFTTDGVTPPTNARILVWEQSSTLENGIYTLTNQGSGAVAWILTRATDYDQPAEIQPGDLVIINNGTLYGGSSFIETASVSAIGTDPILFSQFTFSASAVLLKANNLSDVASTTTSFNNISPLTTKGDLIGYNAGNVRLAVGMTDGQVLQVSSGAATGLAWSTATYPVTTTVNQILYSNATNTVIGLASTVGGVLVTDASSVPSFLANPGVTSKMLLSTNGAIPTWSTSTIPTSAGATANKVLLSDGTNYALSIPTFPNASATARKIIVSDGTNWIASTETYAVPGTSGNVLTSNGTNWTSAAPASSGTVSTGLINQLAYYAAAGNTVSGLAIVNSAGLTTTSGGVPTWVAYTGTGAPVLGTSPTITGPLINAISDQTFHLPVMVFTGAASAVNYIAAINGATGTSVGFQYSGSDANVSVTHATKGTGTHSFYGGIGVGSGYPILSLTPVASAVNYINIASTVAGVGPTIAAIGSDTDIYLQLISKGNAGVVLQSNGAAVLNAANPASPVNYFTMVGSATGSAIGLLATGTDSNVPMLLTAKGTSGITLANASGTANILALNAVASAVNYVNILANATGSNAAIYAGGSDANITLQIQGQGTGGVYIVGVGTNSAAVTGQVGEVLTAANLAASPIVFTTGVAKTLQTVTLTPGDWDVWGNLFASGTTTTSGQCGIHTTTNVMPDNSLIQYIAPIATTTAVGMNAPQRIFKVAASTTQAVFLVGIITGAGTLNASGGIYARRRR